MASKLFTFTFTLTKPAITALTHAQPQCSTNTSIRNAPHTCHIMRPMPALQNQHRKLEFRIPRCVGSWVLLGFRHLCVTLACRLTVTNSVLTVLIPLPSQREGRLSVTRRNQHRPAGSVYLEVHVRHACDMHVPATAARIWTGDAGWAAHVATAHIWFPA